MSTPVGGYILAAEPVEINARRPRTKLAVRNTGDRPVQVGSHFHFFEVNRALEFDRELAFGHRLDIAASTVTAHYATGSGAQTREPSGEALIEAAPVCSAAAPSRPVRYPNGRVMTDDVFSARMIFMVHGQATPSPSNPTADLLAEFPYLGPPNP